MARIRSIKPEFWSSEQVMDCSITARLLFIGLWNFCDDAGNHPASAKTIKAQILPGDDITSESVQLLLDELSSNSLITLYAAQGKDYWHVNGWQHQKIDKPTMKFPPFIPANTESTSRTLGESSPPEGKGRGEDVDTDTDTDTERKGREGIPSETNSTSKNFISDIAKILRQIGINNFNLNNPKFVALSNAGLTIPEFEGAAVSAKKKNFDYIIGMLVGQREEAKSLNLHQGELPGKQKPLHEKRSQVAQQMFGDLANGNDNSRIIDVSPTSESEGGGALVPSDGQLVR